VTRQNEQIDNIEDITVGVLEVTEGKNLEDVVVALVTALQILLEETCPDCRKGLIEAVFRMLTKPSAIEVRT
jgi:hypothetical protein